MLGSGAKLKRQSLTGPATTFSRSVRPAARSVRRARTRLLAKHAQEDAGAAVRSRACWARLSRRLMRHTEL